uniref:Adenine-specific methyltransferase n=1 Tax=Myoviridae sp. ctRRy11 TaxID=2826651 RepID=A0A8S5MY37_9CAUD|nr:MAG TPA: adenine-specific methyltransferase [Myoviridae sp. ctRRy11]
MKDWKGNANSIYKTLGASNHTDKEREINDFYATDPIAIDKLLKAEKPHCHIWECAAGEGHLAEKLKEFGFEVTTSDIIERQYKLDFTQDFLQMSQCGLGTNEEYDILTNPPYKYAKEFVLKALESVNNGRKVYMFLKLTFLEGKARYKELFSKYPPKKVYVFSERVLCAKNAEFQKMKDGGGSAVAYAWYVWEKGYQGKTEIEWI